MASIGLALARGSELHDAKTARADEETRRQEELDRFLAARALYDVQLANEELAAKEANINAENSYNEAAYVDQVMDSIRQFIPAIQKGDVNAFLQVSEATGSGWTYDQATKTLVNSISGAVIPATAGHMLTEINNFNLKPTQVVESAYNAKVASDIANAEHTREMSKIVAEANADIAVENAKNGGAGGVSKKDLDAMLKTPEQVQVYLNEARTAVAEQNGVVFNPLTGTFQGTKDGEFYDIAPEQAAILEQDAQRLSVYTAENLPFSNSFSMGNNLRQGYVGMIRQDNLIADTQSLLTLGEQRVGSNTGISIVPTGASHTTAQQQSNKDKWGITPVATPIAMPRTNNGIASIMPAASSH